MQHVAANGTQPAGSVTPASDRAHDSTTKIGKPEQAGEKQVHKPLSPVGHGARDVTIEFGKGSLTGSITASFDLGTSGIGDDKFAALKTGATAKLNGFAVELETALLGGEMDLEVLDGVSITFEGNVMKVTSDGEETDIDLATIGVAIEGDVAHWLNVPGVGMSIKGNLEFALGGKLAGKLTKYLAAQAEQRRLVKELDEVTHAMERQAQRVKQLQDQLALMDSKTVGTSAREKLAKELMAETDRLAALKEPYKKLGGKLGAAKKKAAEAISKVQGKVAQKIANAMEKKMVKFVATKLAKLVPVLNIISGVMDVIELIGIIHAIANGQTGGSGDEDNKKGNDSDSAGTSGGKGSASAGDVAEGKASGGKAGDSGTTAAANEAANLEARNKLAPTARTLVDALTLDGLKKGPSLDADQIAALGILIPSDLSEQEVKEVLVVLKSKQSKAKTSEDVIAAITNAIHEVRSKQRTVTVDGQARPDLAAAGQESGAPVKDDGLITAPSQVEGPVTSPSQIDTGVTGAEDANATPLSHALAVVRGGSPSVIARWFRREGDALVLSPEGERWKAEHVNTSVGDGLELMSVEGSAEKRGDGWFLSVRFELWTENGDKKISSHSFGVTPSNGPPVFGATFDGLTFEPIVIVDL